MLWFVFRWSKFKLYTFHISKIPSLPLNLKIMDNKTHIDEGQGVLVEQYDMTGLAAGHRVERKHFISNTCSAQSLLFTCPDGSNQRNLRDGKFVQFDFLQKGSAVSYLQRSLVPLLKQQMWSQGAKKHLGFTGTRHNILETSSLLPGQDSESGRDRESKLNLKDSLCLESVLSFVFVDPSLVEPEDCYLVEELNKLIQEFTKHDQREYDDQRALEIHTAKDFIFSMLGQTLALCTLQNGLSEKVSGRNVVYAKRLALASSHGGFSCQGCFSTML
ncbi:hypothetical protein Q9966_008800 [Columba livia]|nr:hypothetical protein Q9966_008800 [Columba livia]